MFFISQWYTGQPQFTLPLKCLGLQSNFEIASKNVCFSEAILG